jgi:hypothetical protein
MNVLIFSLLVAGAAAQYFEYPGYHHAGYPFVAPVAPFVHPTGYPFVNKEAIKTEWDEKDGSPKKSDFLKEIEKKEAEKKDWEKKAFVASPYSAYPAVYHPYAAAYPTYYPTVELKNFDEKKKEGARRRRDVAAFPTPLHRDFAYASTDLNQDGQPDSKQYYPTHPYTYSAYPYQYGAYPYSAYNSYYTPKYFY